MIWIALAVAWPTPRLGQLARVAGAYLAVFAAGMRRLSSLNVLGNAFFPISVFPGEPLRLVRNWTSSSSCMSRSSPSVESAGAARRAFAAAVIVIAAFASP